MTTYLQEEIDSLLWRRNGMLLSFFMALYLDPQALKKRFSPSTPEIDPLPATDGSGSGGVTQDPMETSEHISEDQDKNPNEDQQDNATVLSQSSEVEGEAVPDASSQIDVLEDIVNGSDTTSEASSEELDLFE